MDRRIILAVFLMMVVAVVPSLIFKAPPRPPQALVADSAGVLHDTTAAPTAAAPGATPAAAPAVPAPPGAAKAAAPAHEDTVTVTSGSWRLRFSTRGARLISAELLTYRSLAPGVKDQPVELVHRGGSLLDLTVVSGQDSVALDGWSFTPSARTLDVAGGPAELTFTGTDGARTVTLTYRFRPDDYRFDVAGQVRGLGPTGGFLLVHLGDGLPNTEGDTLDNARYHALVVKPIGKSTSSDPFYKIGAGKTRAEAGPFTWVASKSKYFVLGFFAPDSSARWAAAVAQVPEHAAKYAGVAALGASMPLTAAGAFRYRVYAGPMEYSHLSAVGDDFDDVNPYGWPGFRTVIRPFALGFRVVFVWLHTHLAIGYGMAVILISLLIRLALWPLNQKAMRSAMAMQAIQPHIKELQERHKANPEKLQQEMFKLYREHNVNPLGGCLPMLLPMPILFALFFVFESTIELRGVSFLWFPDLSQADPLHIIPLVTGISMFALSRVGQRGLPPNPQAKMMMYMTPVMFTFIGWRLAAGLNLYYVVSNLASLPQQWLISEERRKRNLPGTLATPAGGRK